MIKCPHCNKSKNREYNYIRIQTFIVCMISPPFLIDMQTFPPETLYKKNSLSKYNPDFFYLCIIEHHNPYPNGGK
ncbi:Uncharacterised protein [Bacteroides thetaiotaomicron]|uniref:Uncharacterized protein n=1 Tax=Bacteroides thetaiotaomicron TaxID=818 RepID=A0A174TF33_BACT4|nr:Uncharacterised protein [Bacteroides thetaiotaomicron]